MYRQLSRLISGAILFGLLGIALAIPGFLMHIPLLRWAAYACGGLAGAFALVELFIWCSMNLSWKHAAIAMAVALLVPAAMIWGLRRAHPTDETPPSDPAATVIDLVIPSRPPDPLGSIETALSETRPGYTSETLVRVSSEGTRPSDLAASGIIVQDNTSDGASATLASGPDNNLLFSMTGTNGKTDSLGVPLGSGGVPYDQNVSVATEAGNTAKSGFMRILVNGKEVAFRLLNDGIAFGKGDWRPSPLSTKLRLTGILTAAAQHFAVPWALSSSKLEELIINTRLANPAFFAGDEGILYPALGSETDGSSPLAGTFMRNTYPP
jgi:hypothetical protein